SGIAALVLVRTVGVTFYGIPLPGLLRVVPIGARRFRLYADNAQRAHGGGHTVVGATPFVGREREVAALRERLVRARAGQGGLALISGDAGIGKTRLLDEFAAQAIAGGCRVLRGCCVATG